ncbi:MAG: HoxN/HupN/NixA family nickel/cobalt transporter, partial [Gaiellaceae bacterium]
KSSQQPREEDQRCKGGRGWRPAESLRHPPHRSRSCHEAARGPPSDRSEHEASIINLFILLDVVRIFRGLRHGRLDEEELEQRLAERGLMNRLFIGRLLRFVSKSWHTFPLGLAFGLGFDTASEVALLAVAAGAATHQVPVPALASLPILFAAGMSLMDTADGAFMSRAYGWAFSNPIRKVYYNITVTSLSVAVALAVGSVELLQVLAARLSHGSGFWESLSRLDLGTVGYGIVGLFVLTWGISLAVWKTRRIEQRWSEPLRAESD